MPDDRGEDRTEDRTEGHEVPAPSIADWGLASAAAVVERMLELGRAGASGLRLTFPPNAALPPFDAGLGAPVWGTDPERGAEGESSADPADRARQARRFRADAERMVELYADFTRMLVDGAASLAEQAVGIAPDGGAGRSGGDSTTAPGVLVLGPASAGATTTAAAWLHVLDGPSAAPAPLHATSLIAHDGAVVPAAAVSCTPTHLDTSVARASAEVRISVVVPAGTASGSYHGHLLAAGLPEVALAVRLEVVA